jgi:NADH-quinone oxidoreductase subunit N
MAVATKVAALGAALRLFDVALIEAHASWGPALAALATITILVGNVGALGQSSLKRMLAYSSVAQAGYILAGIVVATQLGAQATVFYLAVYLPMNMAAFAVIVARERETELGDSVAALAGLGRERPWLAWPMTVSMLALAGIPATAGFIGKFYLIDAAVSGGYTWLGVLIVVGSMLSLGYYLPVVAAIWTPPGEAAGQSPSAGASPPSAASGPIPAIAGGSQELDGEEEMSDAPNPVPQSSPIPSGTTTSSNILAPTVHIEVTFVAVLAAAATIVLGIVPGPLFTLVHGIGSALGLM